MRKIHVADGASMEFSEMKRRHFLKLQLKDLKKTSKEMLLIEIASEQTLMV